MVKARQYGVDVSNYQGTNLAGYHRAGAKFAIVMLGQGTYFRNGNAAAQIRSAKANGMATLAYFYATYGYNSSQAAKEARTAVRNAHMDGLPKGSYLAIDWESNQNYIYGPVGSNTTATLVAMSVIAKAGYRPLFYTYTGMMARVNLHRIVSKHGTCLWLANYPYAGATYSAPVSWMRSIYRGSGLLIWQFTDNFCGLAVDGNIAMASFKHGSSKHHGGDYEMALHPLAKYTAPAVAVVRNKHYACLYDSPALSHKIGKRKHGSSFIAYEISDGAVKVGHRQYFDGRAVALFANPIATNSNKAGICKVIKGTHAFEKPSSASKKGHWIKAGTKLRFSHRSGKWLRTKLGWVTGNRAYIML